MNAGGEIVVQRIPDPRVTLIAAKGGKGGGSSSSGGQDKPTIAPNTLRSLATVRILEVLSEGPIHGPAENEHSDFQSVYLDDTAVVDPAGNWQYKITEGAFRLGLPEQEPIPGFPVAEVINAVGIQTRYDVPIIRACQTPPLHAIRYVLRIPALYTQTDKGDINPSSVAYTVDLAVNGGAWVNVISEQISGKTMSAYERAVRVQLALPNPASLQIRLTRTSIDPDANTTQNLLFWSSFVEIVDGQLAYDDTAIAAMAMDAETFPQVPQRGYLLDGLKLDVPANYDSRAASYAGDWDGTWKQAWTDNPAWVLYGILTNERWGLGGFLDATMIDKWSFYEAAQNNDALVIDGAGGSERRWRSNCVINTRQDAYTVLNSIASTMLGLLYWSNGTVFLVQDRLITTPGRLFGPADVEGGLFDYQGTDYRSRWTAVAVTWNDPSDSYQQAVELVLDQELVALQGYRETQQHAFGCTSRGQAIRFGRWLIYTSQYELEAVTFRVGLENADLRPGDLVAINDPGRAGARLAGRLLDDDGTDTVTLDKAASEITAIGWTLYVTVGSAADAVMPTVLALRVVDVLPDNQFRVAGKTKPAPAGSTWLASHSTVTPTHWRVAAISDRGNTSYEVLATEYHQEKFAYVDDGVLIPPPPFSLIPTGNLTGPSDVNHSQYMYLDGSGVPQFGVVLSWQASPDPRVTRVQLEMSGPGGDYRRFRQVAGVSQDVPSMRQGEWLATIVGFDNIGRRSVPITYTFTPTGLSEKPLAPLALYLTPQGAMTTLVWVPSGEIDVASYWVKWSPVVVGPVLWSRATTTIAQVNRTTTQTTTPTRAGTYMVKAVDALGQESETWAEARLSEQLREQVKIIEKIEQPDWTGSKGAHWTTVVDELRLPPPVEPEAIPPGVFPGDRSLALNSTPTRVDVYGFASQLDLGVVCQCAMVGIVEGLGSVGDNTMSSWVPLASAKPLANDESDQWDAHIEVRVSQDDLTFGPWSPVNSATITGRTFEWRIVGAVFDLATTLRLVRGEVHVELPLRTLAGSDRVLDGTGHLTVTYPVPFIARPTVQLTAREDLAPGGSIVITASNTLAFTVEHRDASGAPTAGGSIDYLVQGYGGHR